jgi:hypothetical protein
MTVCRRSTIDLIRSIHYPAEALTATWPPGCSRLLRNPHPPAGRSLHLLDGFGRLTPYCQGLSGHLFREGPFSQGTVLMSSHGSREGQTLALL